MRGDEMNSAVFISVNPESSVSEKICKLQKLQMDLGRLCCQLEQHVGVLEIKQNKVEITASRTNFNEIRSLIREIPDEIWKLYEELHSLGVIKIVD